MEEENIIFSYTTKEAVADGSLIQIKPEVYRQQSIKFPVYMTSAVWTRYVTVPGDEKQFVSTDDKAGYLLSQFSAAARKFPGSIMKFKVLINLPEDYDETENEIDLKNGLRTVTFKSVITAQDIDDPSPAIFIMLPSED